MHTSTLPCVFPYNFIQVNFCLFVIVVFNVKATPKKEAREKYMKK